MALMGPFPFSFQQMLKNHQQMLKNHPTEKNKTLKKELLL